MHHTCVLTLSMFVQASICPHIAVPPYCSMWQSCCLWTIDYLRSYLKVNPNSAHGYFVMVVYVYEFIVIFLAVLLVLRGTHHFTVSHIWWARWRNEKSKSICGADWLDDPSKCIAQKVILGLFCGVFLENAVQYRMFRDCVADLWIVKKVHLLALCVKVRRNGRNKCVNIFNV